MDTNNTRIGDCIICNPTVKLEKGKECPVIDIDKITVGRKFVENKETVIYSGQGGAKFENGDTLMARITPCLENGKIAHEIKKEDLINKSHLLRESGIKEPILIEIINKLRENGIILDIKNFTVNELICRLKGILKDEKCN